VSDVRCRRERLCSETRHASNERRSSRERLVPDTFQEQHEGRPVVHDENGEEDSDIDDDQRRTRLYERRRDGRQTHDTMRGWITRRDRLLEGRGS